MVPSTTARLLSLDALRGLAVFLMIEQHLGVWLWKGTRPNETALDYWWLYAFNALGGGAAPLFVTLAGIGSALLVHKRTLQGRHSTGTMLRRGLMVMAFGYLLSFLTPTWFSWRSWFVLHLMGFGMLLTPGLRRLNSRQLIGLTVFVVLSSTFVQVALETPTVLSNRYMSGRLAPVPDFAVLRIALAEGQFPIFPWLAFFVAGFASGRWIASGKLHLVGRSGAWSLLLGGLGATLGQLGLGNIHPVLERGLRLPVPFFPSSPVLTLLLLGLVLLGTYFVLRWEARRPLSERSFSVTLGRASLSLLLLHVYLFRELSRPIGWWKALPAGSAFAILIAFLILAMLASRQWQRMGYRYGAEWLLRKFAP